MLVYVIARRQRKLVPNHNLNVVTSLREHYASITRALREHYASITRALREHYASITRALRKHYVISSKEELEQAARDFCTIHPSCPMGVLREYKESKQDNMENNEQDQLLIEAELPEETGQERDE